MYIIIGYHGKGVAFQFSGGFWMQIPIDLGRAQTNCCKKVPNPLPQPTPVPIKNRVPGSSVAKKCHSLCRQRRAYVSGKETTGVIFNDLDVARKEGDEVSVHECFNRL
jgi:hypothetical protein